MKKLIIFGYFASVLLLTLLVVKVTATYASGPIEVKYREHSRELSDTEISQRGIIPTKGKDVEEKWKTKETRTKGLFGWETKIDTIEAPQTYYVDCQCGD